MMRRTRPARYAARGISARENTGLASEEARDARCHRRVDRGELRDRALIGLMVYTFARVSAAIDMHVKDVQVQGRRT